MTLKNLELNLVKGEQGSELHLTFDFPEQRNLVNIYAVADLPYESLVDLSGQLQADKRLLQVFPPKASSSPRVKGIIKLTDDIKALAIESEKNSGKIIHNIIKLDLWDYSTNVSDIKVVDRRFSKGKDTLYLNWDGSSQDAAFEAVLLAKLGDGQEYLLADGIKGQDFYHKPYAVEIPFAEEFDLTLCYRKEQTILSWKDIPDRALERVEDRVSVRQDLGQLSGIAGKNICLNHLRREGDNRFDEGLGKDVMTVSWLYPTEVQLVEIYSGHFSEVDWTADSSLPQLLKVSKLLKTVDPEEAQRVNGRIDLEVLEDEPYDLLFVPIDRSGHRHIAQNIIWNNPKRRRKVIWRVVESPMSLKEFKFGKPLKQTSIYITTEETETIPKEALRIRFSGSDDIEQLPTDFSRNQPLPQQGPYAYVSKDQVNVAVNDGYEGIILRKG